LFAYILKKESAFVKSNQISATTAVKSSCPAPKALKKQHLPISFPFSRTCRYCRAALLISSVHFTNSLSALHPDCNRRIRR